METGSNPPTDYGAEVTRALGAMTRARGAVDQGALRACIALASSYLVTDVSTRGGDGFASWGAGLDRLVDVLVALHARGELELETVNQVSKACSECWSVALTWRGYEESKEVVRGIAGRLKQLLDANGRTYGGERVYAPY